MRVFMVLMLAVSAVVHAEDGFAPKKLKLTAGKVRCLDPVVSVPYDGPQPKHPLRVRETATGKQFPATVKDGQFVFVPEGGAANSEHTYIVKEDDLGASYQPVVQIRPKGDEVLEVYIEDKLLTAYYHAKDGKKPYLWPLNSADGVTLTRDYPMAPVNKSNDHIHHRSFWSAYGDVNGADCWTEEPKSGFQQSGEVSSGSGDAFGWIHAKNVWQDHDRKPEIDEERDYRFYATPETGRVIDVTVTFSAAYGDVKFGDTKEGGIVAVRMRDELTGANAIITNALGDVGEPNTWGKPAPWCDYSGPVLDKGTRGITIFDTPGNLRYPTSWHVRAYGLMGANCFGWHYFSEKDYNKPLLPSNNGDYEMKKGDKLTFKYRVYVHSGDVKEAGVADRYAVYTEPPVAKWVD